MLIYLPRHNKIITAVEGTGDNLLPEDEKDGFVDYLLTALYEQDGMELKLIDEGQLLSQKYFADMTTNEKADRLLDYWELSNNPGATIIEDLSTSQQQAIENGEKVLTMREV